jgi:hypothetical protein
MSPEQCDGDGHIDFRADQYALGCILYELLCGRPPFASDSPMELFNAHRFQAPAPPRTIVPLIPAEVERVILKLLAKSRDHRFPDMDRVRIALDNSLTPEADMDTLTEDVPDALAPPPAAPPYAPGPASSLSGSSGQMISAPVSPPMSTPMGMPQLVPQIGYPRNPTGSLVARPVRLPSIPGTMRRMTPLYWALAGLASIFIGFGIVYMLPPDPDPAPTVQPEAQANPEAQPEARIDDGPEAQPEAQIGTGPPATPENLAAPDAQPANGAAPGASGDDAIIEMEPDDAPSPGPAAGTPPTGTPPAGTPPAGTPAPGTSTKGTPATGTPAAGTPAGNPGQSAPTPPAPPALVDVGLELEPPGATVTVDGQARTERPLRLAPRLRPYSFVVTAPGFQRKEISVRVDRAKSVRIALEPEQQGIDL